MIGPTKIISPRQRWTVRRKAAVVQAVRAGQLTIERVQQVYALSLDEFRAWERDLDRYGVPGLRATRLQIYKQTDALREQRALGAR